MHLRGEMKYMQARTERRNRAKSMSLATSQLAQSRPFVIPCLSCPLSKFCNTPFLFFFYHCRFHRTKSRVPTQKAASHLFYCAVSIIRTTHQPLYDCALKSRRPCKLQPLVYSIPVFFVNAIPDHLPNSSRRF